MATLTGLLQRGTAYYLRIVLPLNHPLKRKFKNGIMVAFMGPCSHREAVLKSPIRRAQVFGGGARITLRDAGCFASPPWGHSFGMSMTN